eukprot:753239-Pyramimonas_sp.AAC.2
MRKRNLARACGAPATPLRPLRFFRGSQRDAKSHRRLGPASWPASQASGVRPQPGMRNRRQALTLNPRQITTPNLRGAREGGAKATRVEVQGTLYRRRSSARSEVTCLNHYAGITR